MSSEPSYVPPTADPKLYNWPEGQPKPIETPHLPSEPSVPLVQSETDGSSSAVEQQEIALRLRHAHLSDALPGLKAAEARAIEERRTAVAEMAVIVRLLKAHERLKAPRKRR